MSFLIQYLSHIASNSHSIWEIQSGYSGNIDGTNTQMIIINLYIGRTFYSQYLQTLDKPSKLMLIL